MVLPFFGKKPSDIDDQSLDGTGAAGNQRGPNTESSALGFTQLGDVGRGLAAAAERIQVSEGSAQHAAAEEAAILYANANDAGARAVLESAIAAISGRQHEELWQMLLDLYRLMHARDAFDIQAVEYAQRFEKSPPMWDEAESSLPVKRDGGPTVNLAGNLTGQAASQFDQLVRIGEKNGTLRIDVGRVRAIDAEGGEFLYKALQRLKRAGVGVDLLNSRHLYELIKGMLKQGQKEFQANWLLALIVLEQLGENDQFEELALDYAITFEESPPSWDPPKDAAQTDTDDLIQATTFVEDQFLAEGDILGAQHESIRKLSAYGRDKSCINIDASKLRRIDFVGAGALFNLFAQYQAQGKQVIILHPNAMIAALLHVMGVNQVAQIQAGHK